MSRFPYAPGNRNNPGEASKETLFALHDLLGIEGGLVQAGYHGVDATARLR